MQMAMSGGRRGGSMGQQQDGGGLGQFFRGDLPQKLGMLLVSWWWGLRSAPAGRQKQLPHMCHALM